MKTIKKIITAISRDNELMMIVTYVCAIAIAVAILLVVIK